MTNPVESPAGPVPGAGASTPTGSPADNESIVRAVLEAQVRGDLEGVRHLFAPDVVYHLKAYQKTFRGIEEFYGLLNGYYGRSQDFRSDVIRAIAQGDYVALQGHESYVLDGAAVAFDYASWVRLEGGRIVEWSDYFDSRLVGKQLKAGRAAG
jgi:ketosteroid isomerase-like protein